MQNINNKKTTIDEFKSVETIFDIYTEFRECLHKDFELKISASYGEFDALLDKFSFNDEKYNKKIQKILDLYENLMNYCKYLKTNFINAKPIKNY